MSSDDSDTDRGEAEASRSGANGDAGGQRRDPETGQFLPKDERETAETGDGAASPDRDDDGADASEPDRDDGADGSGASGSGTDSARGGSVSARETPPLRVTRVPVRGPSPRDRASVGPSEPVLPPSLHLVPMQVQCTGEPVRVGPSGRVVGLEEGRRRVDPSEGVRPIRRGTR